jgi:hypothetical protein
MKAKKAVRRLDKAKVLLTSVIDQYAANKAVTDTRDLLRAAVGNIDQAQASIKGNSTPPAVRAAKAREVGPTAGKHSTRISEEGRRRLSLAAKRRWAAAKRKGARTLSAA